ncbi:MAG: formate dehydrogenase accessory protein FdhE [Alphaproteobacteria bacterium]|nr:formate dehydrogenase accessory protein FdhE [Alphaproteobacteria bacterium]
MSLKGRVVPDPVDIGQIAAPPFVRLPDIATHFAARATRLDALAPGNPLEPFLRFVADIARAQHKAAGALSAGMLPGDDHIAFCKAHRFALIERLTWVRDASFVSGARAIARALIGVRMPEAAASALAAFTARDDKSIDALADRLLREEQEPWDMAEVPFVAAALELHWARMAARLDPAVPVPLEPRSLCPVCGSTALTSVVEAAAGRQGSRFLCCGLCQARWNYTRIQCAHCVSTKGIAYHHVEGGSKAVRAETCDECRTYTKALYLEEAPDLDPVADDLATLPLDLLVGEAGWRRARLNWYLMPQDEEAPEPLSATSA